MRRALIVLALTACEAPPPHLALPELVAAQTPRAIAPSLLMVPNETLIWDVHMQGFTIGRLEWAVEDDRVYSKFATSSLASAVSRARHELTTYFDHGQVTRAVDHLEVDGDTTHVETTFFRGKLHVNDHDVALPPGNVGHTLHSALSALRAWVGPDARPGFLYVVHAGEVYELEFQQPFVETLRGTRTLRVEVRVHGDPSLAMSIWFSPTPARTPVRFEVRSDDVRLAAELISS